MDHLERIKRAYLSSISLFSLFSEEEIGELCRSESAELRCWVAKALSIDNKSSVGCAILCTMSNDSDPMVRVEAVDSLSNYVNHESYQCLRISAADPDGLVRAYAAYGLAVVGQHVESNDTLRILHEMLVNEKCDRVRVGILEALYILGEVCYLPEMIQLFETDDYLVRCSVIYALDEIADENNHEALMSFLRNTDFSDEFPAVISALEQLKETLATFQLDN